MHIDEEILEKYILIPELLGDTARDKIKDHIEGCSRCKELYNTLTKINIEIKDEIGNEPLDIDEEVARRILVRKEKIESARLLTATNSIQIFNGKAEIISRPKLYSLQGIGYLIKHFPAQVGGFGLIAVLAIGFIIVTLRNTQKDLNPVTLKAYNSVLSAFNKEGDLLWKKNIDGIPDYGIDSLQNWSYDKKRFLNLVDIDGDGKNELLLSGRYEDRGLFRSDTLYCFNYDGSSRWAASPESKKINYAPTWKRTHWVVTEFFTVKTKSGPKLFVYAPVASYGGTILSFINPKDGSVLSSIFHSGYSISQYHYDFDKDGNDEIIMGGTSSFDKPFIMILKSDFLMGAMPDYFTKQNYIKGNALYYILLPVSNLGKLLSTTSGSYVSNIYKFNNGGIAVLSNDVAWNEKDQIALQFAFDSAFTCKSVTGGTSYSLFYDKYYKKGILKTPIDLVYKSLKDSVLYWDGDKFVNYPTKNKYWNEPFRLPDLAK